MNVSELKESLHEAIENIEDENLLGVVRELVLEEYHPTEFGGLTPMQRNDLGEAETDLAQGRVMSLEKSNEMIDEWLTK